MNQIPQSPVALTFLLLPTMTKEDIQTELSEHIVNLPSDHVKQTTETIPVCIGVVYENILTATRTAAANAKTS